MSGSSAKNLTHRVNHLSHQNPLYPDRTQQRVIFRSEIFKKFNHVGFNRWWQTDPLLGAQQLEKPQNVVAVLMDIPLVDGLAGILSFAEVKPRTRF